MIELAPHPLVIDAPGGTCWKRSARRRHAAEPGRHAELVVLHALTGSAEYVVDGTLVELRAGTLLWALSGQAHFLLSDQPDFDMWVFLISARILPDDLRGSPEMPPLAISDAGDGLPPRVITRSAATELDVIAQGVTQAGEASVRLAGLRWWLARAWAHWQSAANLASRRLHPAVDRAAVLLQADPNMPLHRLAREAGLSESRLAQVFKKEVGRTLQEFRTGLKLDHVDHLVERGKVRDLTSAALAAGFGSYSQFFRVFMKARGQSPRSYFKSTGP